MKKIILVPALLGVMGIGGLVALGDGNIIGSANSADILSKSEIEKKALKEVNGKITELEYEKEGLKSFYEVEVTTSDAEYDLLFDAQTGELLKKHKETFRNKVKSGDGNSISTNSSDILSKSEIEKKALKEVDGKITDLEYEKEGLKSYYEVEVTTSDAEYDLLFDAQTGELLKKQKKTFRNKVKSGDGNITGSANSSGILSKSEIEKKALKEVDGKITDLEYEKEGLKSYYEVEVTTSDAEYDLLFDAQTGELLKKHKETNDDDDWYDDDDDDRYDD
ncbi:PepSY domain-containing protein [Lysinibacillus endophyticus]|uniref:PepSY domain-containing protein n=1 Tax=Ureibacillus endophyticus TaxID=1978490 RepID=UPI0020A0688D|nr:PepSY domain-containing protein [Lysinibacillus endophyticus]MCP1146144.1 PepSY domain-containing protein [Lysinibacillus endophyticus]